MEVKLSGLSDTAKTWIPPAKKKVKTERVSKDVKLNRWSVISWNGATSFHIYKTNMKNDIYQGILEEHVMEIEDTYEGREINFQQDSHTTHGNVKILEGYPNIELLGFPTYSQDLNPIENL